MGKSAESFYIKRYKEGNVEIEINSSFKDTLRISNIQVDKDAMGRGLGSRALKEITDAADKNNLTITANVKPSGVGGLSKDQLHKWYASYGFKRKPFALQPNKLSDEIIREPKTK
jgi:GNAT superfamily N-acetyltransferase